MDRLKLVAFDPEDLAILSAYVQDAVLKVGDVAFLPKEQRFALVMNRFVWETEEEGRQGKNQFERRRTGLHFDRVRAVRSTGIKREATDSVLELLAIGFEPTAGPDAPDGKVTLVFAGGSAIELDVECLEAAMSDLGPAWSTSCCPKHDLGNVA